MRSTSARKNSKNLHSLHGRVHIKRAEKDQKSKIEKKKLQKH